MRNWATPELNKAAERIRRPSPANRQLLKTINERREYQQQLADDYRSRKAAEARVYRDGVAAGHLAAKRAADAAGQPTAAVPGVPLPGNPQMGAEGDEA